MNNNSLYTASMRCRILMGAGLIPKLIGDRYGRNMYVCVYHMYTVISIQNKIVYGSLATCS